MAHLGDTQWILVVPMKHASIAKSRLASFGGPARASLARAMAADTVAAALQCLLVRAVVVVTDDALAASTAGGLGAVVVPDEPAAGLNPALEHGASAARRLCPGGGAAGVGALSGDLPALRPAELCAALVDAPASSRSFVTDAVGSGTTLLLAPAGQPLGAHFGPDSAAAHRASGAVELTSAGLDSLRRDVDTEEDVTQAVRLGIGPRTAAVLAELDARRRRRRKAETTCRLAPSGEAQR